MGEHDRPTDAGASSAVRAQFLEPLRAALQGADEPQRYRLLAFIFGELADERAAHGNGQGGQVAEQIESARKRIAQLEEEKASIEDSLRVVESEHRDTENQLASKLQHEKELEEVIQGHRTRNDSLKEKIELLDAELVARNAELHKAEVTIEELQLGVQRSALASTDTSKVDDLERVRVDLGKELESLRADMDQLRSDKETEIAGLQQKLAQANSASSEGSDSMLTELWERLARATPSLAEGNQQPNLQAGQRLVDTTVELAKFVDEFDKGMRVFITRYTKHNPSVRVPWESYARGGDLLEFCRRTVAAQGGRPVGPLKMRLRLFHSWMYAAMIGCDAAIESIETELQSHLLGPEGAGANPNATIRDYIRGDGPPKFAEQMKRIRSTRLAETYGRG